MKPIPMGWLLTLMLVLCGLCAWQWYRESGLRKLTVQQASELVSVRAELMEATARTKAANAEILRLTGAVSELRANSLPLEQQEQQQAAHTELKETIARQTELLRQQKEAIDLANASISKANASIQKTAEERDALARRLNDLTAKYNKLARQ